MRPRPLVPLLGVLLALAGATDAPAADGLVARWSTSSRVPLLVWESYVLTIERSLGDLHREDEYAADDPVALDSLAGLGVPGRVLFTRLAEGIQDQWTSHDNRYFHRRFIPGAVDAPMTDPDASVPDDSLRFVAADTVAGFATRRYESRAVDSGFPGMKDADFGRVDKVTEIWLAPRRGLLVDYEALRARVPLSGIDTVTAPGEDDTLLVPGRAQPPWSSRIAGFHPDSVSVVAMSVRIEFMGEMGDSMAVAAARDAAPEEAEAAALEARRQWLVQRRLVLLRWEPVEAAAFELPADAVAYPP